MSIWSKSAVGNIELAAVLSNCLWYLCFLMTVNMATKSRVALLLSAVFRLWFCLLLLLFCYLCCHLPILPSLSLIISHFLLFFGREDENNKTKHGGKKNAKTALDKALEWEGCCVGDFFRSTCLTGHHQMYQDIWPLQTWLTEHRACERAESPFQHSLVCVSVFVKQ